MVGPLAALVENPNRIPSTQTEWLELQGIQHLCLGQASNIKYIYPHTDIYLKINTSKIINKLKKKSKSLEINYLNSLSVLTIKNLHRQTEILH